MLRFFLTIFFPISLTRYLCLNHYSFYIFQKILFLSNQILFAFFESIPHLSANFMRVRTIALLLTIPQSACSTVIMPRGTVRIHWALVTIINYINYVPGTILHMSIMNVCTITFILDMTNRSLIGLNNLISLKNHSLWFILAQFWEESISVFVKLPIGEQANEQNCFCVRWKNILSSFFKKNIRWNYKTIMEI